MILILSQDGMEESTNDVIDWLEYYNHKFYRLNGADLLSSNGFTFKLNSNAQVNGQSRTQRSASKNAINSIWYRRWNDKDFYKAVGLGSDSNEYLEFNISRHLEAEFVALSRGFWSIFNRTKRSPNWINYPNHNRINKLDVLLRARSFGLNIPETLITSSKKELKLFMMKHDQVITKSIGDVNPLIFMNNVYCQYTKTITNSFIKNLPEQFFPSLFQEGIKKMYELRIFFLIDKFYCMAIFSQSSKKTKDDFRILDYKDMPRQVPCDLPVRIRIKLKHLIDDLGLNCCSIDMLKNENGEHFFLEINPVGQFGMVSFPCNYYLEEQLAIQLIKNDKTK